MQQSEWTKAYLVVTTLAVVLMPIGAFVAVLTTASAARFGREAEVKLPDATELFVKLGTGGLSAIAIGSLAVIGISAPWRRSAWPTLLSAGLVIVVLGLDFYAALASFFPYFTIMWKLT